MVTGHEFTTLHTKLETADRCVNIWKTETTLRFDTYNPDFYEIIEEELIPKSHDHMLCLS